MRDKIKIAISGKSGCGNSTVSALVSKALELKMINYTFHDMAKEAGIDFELFCQKAQKETRYDIELDQKQIALAAEGNCVLGSRLAIWLIKEADLKVFLTADAEVRAKRIVKREGGSLEDQSAKTAKRDQCDHQRYLDLYQIDNNDFLFADLVINTNRLDAGSVAQIIITAAKNLC